MSQEFSRQSNVGRDQKTLNYDTGETNEMLSNKDIQSKKTLREQAKQLLLKGCYRMASNKYLQLIKSGISEFLPRQQAIIYLNCGICFQFMSDDNQSNFVQALEFMKNAILIDITYEKTYYRLVQLLRDNGNYQSALSIVPASIKNKEIDQLLKEVRQQYIKKSDFSRMIEKMASKQLTLMNGKMLCFKLAQTQQVEKFLQENAKKIQSQSQDMIVKAQFIGNQMARLYQIIGENKSEEMKSQLSDTRKILMQEFMTFLGKLLTLRLQERDKIPVIDELIEDSLRQYRGQLAKFLEFKVWFKVKDIKLSIDSKFTSQNGFTLTQKRKIFYDSQLRLIKFARLVDVNMQLFGKTYCYLSNKAYEGVHHIILKKPQSKPQDQVFDHKLVHKFLLSNSIDSQQVISKGMGKKDSKIRCKPVFGGHPLYLYENIQINELNYVKQILVQQCHKISEVYESAIIHPLWLQKIHDVLHSVQGLLGIILSMVQVYTARESGNINTFVNKLNDIYELSHLIYIYHWELYAYRQKEKQQEKELSSLSNNNTQQPSQQIITPPVYYFNYSLQQLLNYFDKQNYNFIALYLIQKIIQFNQSQSQTIKTQSSFKVQTQTIKQDFTLYKERTIQICINKITLVKNKINEKKKFNTTEQNYVYKEMYLMLVCMVLKIDIKRKIQIDTELIFNTVFNEITSDVALEGLLLILVNDQNLLKFYLENETNIKKMVESFISKSLIEKLDSFRVLLNVIYMLVCDFEMDQESYFAKKLGVSQKQVHQVRMLQKQAMGNKERQELMRLRKSFKAKMASQWIEIINRLCKILRTTLKMQSSCSSKLCRIIFSIAEINYQKLYSNQIIDFMLESRNIKEPPNGQLFSTKETACKFFQIICKKCNAQIFEYKHIQAIVDSLMWLIGNCDHELIYFESLLGLVNLSTMSVKIPIEEMQKCLYEENSYIMHAGVCVLNNIMIYSEDMQDQDIKSAKIKKRISDVVYEYIEFYRDQILNLQSQLPESDYSHPKKIYNSLISLATVLKIEKVQELATWNDAVKFVKIMNNNQAPELLFKLVIYHSLEQKLPKGWQLGFQSELQALKKSEPQKYSKLTQFM